VFRWGFGIWSEKCADPSQLRAATPAASSAPNFSGPAVATRNATKASAGIYYATTPRSSGLPRASAVAAVGRLIRIEQSGVSTL
jgi:hypothetical protein